MINKYLVVRRDGTIPSWPYFVLGAQDPCTLPAMRAYRQQAINRVGIAYADLIFDITQEMQSYQEHKGLLVPQNVVIPRLIDDPLIAKACESPGKSVRLYVIDNGR